jgi:hypothetical protein
VVVPAVTTTGSGPFGSYLLDTGPYGLSVSAVAEFFVGNVRANGDYYRYVPGEARILAVATLPRRVHSSVAYDLRSMLVAVEGGDLYVVDVTGSPPPRRLGTLGSEITSVRRDPYTGRFHATLRDRRVVSFAPDLTAVATELTTPSHARLAISPDGGLYVLVLGPIGGDLGTATLLRRELPRTR